MNTTCRSTTIHRLSVVCLLALIVLPSLGCNNKRGLPDAYGTFEATEIIVGAQTAGPLTSLRIDEGQKVTAGTVLATVDTVTLRLKYDQVAASLRAAAAQGQAAQAQVAALKVELKTVQRDTDRLTYLVRNKAATPQQVDEIRGKLQVLDKRLLGARAQARAADAQRQAFAAGLAQINEEITRSTIIAPTAGTILTKYIEPGELVAPGKPIVKLADLQTMFLRVYVSEDQLSSLRLGQKVTVAYDTLGGARAKVPGTIAWISDSAEFTPKLIQTRDERVHLVYAVKVRIANTGAVKIGMPGEVLFSL